MPSYVDFESSSPLKILHLDTEKTWRGGENQMLLLLREAPRYARAEFYLATPIGSIAAERIQPPLVKETIVLPMNGLQLWRSARVLADFVRREGIEVLDAQTSRAHNLALMIKRHVPQVKVVVHRRVDYAPNSGWWSRRKYFARAVDQYVAISGAIRDVLVQYGIEKRNITVVRSAVAEADTGISRAAAREALANELNWPKDAVWIASVAYLTDQKGHDVLLRGLRRLKESGVKFVCFIAGDGPLRDSLEQLQRQLGLTLNVKFLGIRKDVPQLLAAADILAMPSNYEGLGTTILDAVHAGCSIVATEVGGIPEIVRHKESGWLSPVGDWDILAENLREASLRPDLREQYHAAAIEHVRREFSLEKMVKGNLAVYESILRG